MNLTSELDNLLNIKPIANKSKLSSLTLICVENFIPVCGRVEKPAIYYFCKYHIVLCKSHLLPRLIILNKYQSSFHTGRDQTATLQEKVWITNAKSLIRSAPRNFSYCKHLNTKPKSSLIGELPRQRLYFELPAFTNTGAK